MKYTSCRGARRPQLNVSAASRAALACAALLLGSACNDPLLKARNSVVVEAGGAKLTGRELERYLTGTRGGLVEKNAGMLVSIWIDYALLYAAERGQLALDDSATVDAAIWPDAAKEVSARRRARLAAAAEAATMARLGALYSSNRVRVFQQVVVRFTSGGPISRVEEGEAKIKDAQRRLKAGESFDSVAKALSEDPSSDQGGYLPATGRGALQPQMDRAGWALPPGGVSGPIHTTLGLHLMRRPPLAEVRSRLLDFERREAAKRLADDRARDTIRLEVVAPPPAVRLVEAASERLKAILREPGTQPGADTLPIAVMKDGAMTVAQLRRWVGDLHPPRRFELQRLPDREFNAFLRNLVVAETELRAEKLVVPSAEARRALGAIYRTDLAASRAALAEHQSAGNDPTKRVAATVDALLVRGVLHRWLPAGLGMVLRQRFPVTVNRAAIETIVRTVESFRGTGDSSSTTFTSPVPTFTPPPGARP